MRPSTRIGNVAFLGLLLLNLVLPGGWVSRAIGAEAQAPATGDVVNAPAAQWMLPYETHATLFGPAQELTSIVYGLATPVTGLGEYAGTNQQGQPFTLEVIRVSAATVIPEQQVPGQHGQPVMIPELSIALVWGTMSTELGSVNVIGSYGHTLSPGDSGVFGLPPDYFMPLVNHDDLMWGRLGSLPDPLSYTSRHKSRHKSRQAQVFQNMSALGPDDGPLCQDQLLICRECAGGTYWCPSCDPEILHLRDVRNDCLDDAENAMFLALHANLAALAIALVGCGATGPAVLACQLTVSAAWAAAFAVILLVYKYAVEACWRDYKRDSNHRQSQVCPSGE